MALILVKSLLAFILVLGLPTLGVMAPLASTEQSADPDAPAERDEVSSRGGSVRTQRNRNGGSNLNRFAIPFAVLADNPAFSSQSTKPPIKFRAARLNLCQRSTVLRI